MNRKASVGKIERRIRARDIYGKEGSVKAGRRESTLGTRLCELRAGTKAAFDTMFPRPAF